MFYVYSESDDYNSYPRFSSDSLEQAVDWGKLNAAREKWINWRVETFLFRAVYRNEDGQETYTHS